PPIPPRMALCGSFTDGVDLAAAEELLNHLRRSRAPFSVAQFRVLGGAVGRVPAEATAFAHRDRAMVAVAGAACAEAADLAEHQAWANSLGEVLHSGAPGAYVGFLGDEGQARVREAYPPPTWERLSRVKAQYDPTNLFRLNQNVPPSTSA
ncbi:MAG: FAD-linked oxidase, partial [Gemmatimonas sp.]|nr:FAD-linked oxidase [Gemmatimonas sp.]